jgi:hypothetical protein
VSVAARKPNMDKITEYVTKNAVYVMLYHNINNDFAQKYVKGIVMKDQSDIQPAGIWLAKH